MKNLDSKREKRSTVTRPENGRNFIGELEVRRRGV